MLPTTSSDNGYSEQRDLSARYIDGSLSSRDDQYVDF
jgi:hypothetical protein